MRAIRFGCTVALLAVLVVHGHTAAQAVRGGIISEADRRPIAQAYVAVLPADGDSAIAARVSADGTFHFDLPDAGRYRLRVQALGYAPLTTASFAVGEGISITLEIKLREDAIALEPLRVVAERMEPLFMRDVRRRRELGFGKVLTREQLEQRSGSTLEDVIRDTGVRVEYAPGPAQSRIPLVIGRESVRRQLAGEPCLCRPLPQRHPAVSAPPEPEVGGGETVWNGTRPCRGFLSLPPRGHRGR